MLKLGTKGIKDLMAELYKLGGVMTTEQAQIAADYADAMERLKRSLEGLKRVAGTELLKVLTDVATAMTEYIVANKELIKLKIEETIKGIGESLKTIAGTIKTIVKYKDDIAFMVKVLRLMQGDFRAWRELTSAPKAEPKEMGVSVFRGKIHRPEEGPGTYTPPAPPIAPSE
jgi:hypothetical protein